MEDKNATTDPGTRKYNLLKNILIYTGLFAIIVGFICYIFMKNGKEFIWHTDGLKQHIVTLEYFRNLLITFIKTGEFSTFTWNIGFGLNMFGNFAYYIFGDIFSYVSIFVSETSVETLYSILIFVRVYFVGISFLYFCKYKKMNTVSSIVGTLMYTFCSFSLFTLVRHPFFMNAMILFPLVMVGIEKIILEDKKIFYTIMIALLFIMNFYFAYMIAVIIAIYGIILIIYTYKEDGAKKVIAKLAQVLAYSLIGIMISTITLIPTITEFLSSGRSGTTEIFKYTINYYRNLMGDLLDVDSGGNWAYWGVQSIILISLPIFIIKRKQNYPIFLWMVILLIPLLIAPIGSILCGFSYPNHRWIFVMSFIFSFITAMFINNETKLERKELIAIATFTLFYMLINYIASIEITSRIEIQVIIAIALLLLITNKDKLEKIFKKKNLYNISLVSMICIGILFSVHYLYDTGDDTKEYVDAFVDSGNLEELVNTSNNTISDFSEAIEYIQEMDEGFYAISKYPYNYENVSLLLDYRAIGYYYSILPNYYTDISLDLQNIQYEINYGIKEFNYRTKITTLLGVKYYITNNKGIVPYGYTKLEDYEGTSSIYVNQYSLPFATLYTDYITEEDYEEMTPLEKESSLLKTVVLEDEEIEETTLEYNAKTQQEIENIISEVDYTVTDEYGILKDDNTVKVTDKSENTIEFEIETVANSEIYLYITGIEYTSNDTQKWYTGKDGYTISTEFNGSTNKKEVRASSNAYYIDNDEMLFNLGYYDQTSGTITLSFSNKGTYNFSSVQILAVSMEGYEEDIENLSKSNFEVIDYGNGYMNGTVNADTDGVLQFSTICNKGWTVYVDGEKVETMCVNEYFLGINITSGEHEIYMEYSTPYLKIAAVISLIGIIVFIGIIIYTKKKKGKQRICEKN